MNIQPVSYLQTDPRWKNIPYAVKGESATIGGSGCGPTAMAMVLATWANPAVTPKTECAWALSHGYKAKGQGTYYAYFPPAAKRYGLTCWQLNAANIYGYASSKYHAAARAELNKGNLVIACMGKGNWTSSGHFVLVWQIEGDTIYINDPASTLARRTRGSYALFRQQVKYYFIIHRPATMPEKEEDMTEEQTKKLIADAISKERTDLLAAVNKLIQEAQPRVYHALYEIPNWAKETIKGLVDAGVLQGDGKSLSLTMDLLRMLVIQDRAQAAKVYDSEKDIPAAYRPGYEYIQTVLNGKETGLALSEDMLRIFTLLARKAQEKEQ